MDLLQQHHDRGRRFEPLEVVEEGPRVAVRIAVTDPAWSGRGETYKVFTFAEDGAAAVLLQDTTGRDDALALLRQQ